MSPVRKPAGALGAPSAPDAPKAKKAAPRKAAPKRAAAPPPDRGPGGPGGPWHDAPPPPPPPRPRRRRKQSPTTKLKRKIAKVTGIPTTASGRKRKAERIVSNFLIDQLDKIDKKK